MQLKLSFLPAFGILRVCDWAVCRPRSLSLHCGSCVIRPHVCLAAFPPAGPGGAQPFTLAQCRRVVIVSDSEKRTPGGRSLREPTVALENGAATTTSTDGAKTRTSTVTLHTSLESGVHLEDAEAAGDVELGPDNIANVAHGAHIASLAEPITSPASASGCGTLQAKCKWRTPCPEQFCSHASYLTFAWLFEYAFNLQLLGKILPVAVYFCYRL